ncbi:aldose 1-epimerase family protein [Agitococcus lubricus]|uniref:Galactose mutarotase-like enzyme n=1 Tax=Agitococcus lubricus TaxID=1077255 RepID=A0A2T5J2Q6_9GAMM|nr:aldose 1-epimerase family protein [Agitococcus lubricus]PTQ90806.1 galactose mutarotase-like enzyme [Agitococcus lubricus]
MYHLENETLKIAIHGVGAELKSVKHKQHAIDYMWRADPEFWGRTSPILFPIVGRLTNNTTLINGQIYEIMQHGFARDDVFDCVHHDANSAHFVLHAQTEHQARYPFNFVLSVIYRLTENSLRVTWHVDNPNACSLPFSIGAHPAFSTQLHADDQFEDYNVIFDTHQQYHLWQLNERMQLVAKDIPFQEPLQQFALSYHYFEVDALVFPHQQIQQITLKNRHHGHGVTVDFKGFPEVALWTADGKHKRSPFLCIEPWFGHADLENGAPELVNKRGIMQLGSGERFTAEYQIVFF